MSDATWDAPRGDEVDDYVLRVDELVAGYIPEVDILNGCNVTVGEGEFVGIIGPNGAGKSTLLKAVLGQCTVRSGQVLLRDQDITGRKAYELVPLGVGYVPQNNNVFPSLTVKENLEMGCFLKPSLFESRFEYVAELFPRLRERAGQRAGALSGGERGRLHMAKTLLQGGNVLLLDEPSNDLDVETLRALEDALLEFPGNAFVISHDRWFLDRIATHILAFEGDSHVEFFQGNYREYEEDKKRRLGDDAGPKRLRFKALK